MTASSERDQPSPDPADPGASAVPRGSNRLVFLDAGFVTWEVSERDCLGAPGARGPRCLLFDSGDVIRRVWHFPEAWRSLSSDALTALSWRR